jgi:hypothetical protein
MIDLNLVKDAFTIIGIFYVAIKLVIGTASLIDKIKLWGFEKGIGKWLTS